MTRSPTLLLTLLLTGAICAPALGQASRPGVTPRAVELSAPDGLKIRGDLYDQGKRAPVVLLCHQARSSRGEYLKIAKRLAGQGYTCLALDQRSGQTWGGVDNETAARAAKKKLATDYLAARQDIEAALGWLRKQGYRGKLALWGSSYSASLALAIGAKHPEVTCVLAFAPGEYFKERDYVRRAAKGSSRPALIVSPEKERGRAKPIADAFAKARFVCGEGIQHGSRTLDRGPRAEGLWSDEVTPFLRLHLRGQRR